MEVILAQRISEIDTRIADLHPQIDLDVHSMDDLAKQITDEKQRLDHLREASLTSPIAGLIWKPLASDGQPLKAGAPVAEMADPTTITVEALFDARHLGAMTIGDEVLVQLMGNGQQVKGVIKDVLRANTIDVATERMAYHFDTIKADSFRIQIVLDSGATPAIGGGARILVTGSQPSAFKRALIWWYTVTKL